MDLWTQYTFAIEEDFSGNSYLFVKIPIAGQELELQLDTGSGRGLAIQEQMWEKIRENIGKVRLSKAKDLYPYIGWLKCKRGVIRDLKVGTRNISKAKVSVFSDDSPVVEDCGGLLGMQYFQDTVLVLDFEENIMWVKGPHKDLLAKADF